MRSIVSSGSMFKLTIPPPPNEGEPTARLPFNRTRVLEAPAPRKLTYAFDWAELPEDSRNEPKEFKAESLSASATLIAPLAIRSAPVIVTTGRDWVFSVRWIREPVTTTSSTSSMASSSAQTSPGPAKAVASPTEDIAAASGFKVKFFNFLSTKISKVAGALSRPQ